MENDDMRNISNYIKATLFFNDITDPTVTVKREQCFTLQQFDYECSRMRNAMGMPYGPTQMTVLRFSIKSLPDGCQKEFYRRLSGYSTSSFSIVFNATFKTGENLECVLGDYDSAMVVTGFVIDIDESFDTANTPAASLPNGGGQQEADLMMTRIGVLLHSIAYIGNNNYKKTLYINY